MIDTKFTEGWGWPGQAKKPHYFPTRGNQGKART